LKKKNKSKNPLWIFAFALQILGFILFSVSLIFTHKGYVYALFTVLFLVLFFLLKIKIRKLLFPLIFLFSLFIFKVILYLIQFFPNYYINELIIYLNPNLFVIYFNTFLFSQNLFILIMLNFPEAKNITVFQFPQLIISLIEERFSRNNRRKIKLKNFPQIIAQLMETSYNLFNGSECHINDTAGNDQVLDNNNQTLE